MTIESINTKEVAIKIIVEKKDGDREYALYSVNARGAEKYLLCISDINCSDAEMIGGSARQAKDFFIMLSDYGASCEHLADLADDYRKMLCKI